MNDLDPATAASLDDLAACLKHVHLLADKPTFRALEQQSARAGGFLPGTRLKRARLTRSTVSDVLLGRKFPGKAFLLTFIDACGVDLENDRRWEQAWDRLAPQFAHAPAQAETDTLRGENEELRLQLAEMQHRAGRELEQLRADAEARRTSAEHELGELRRQLAAAKRQAKAAETHAAEEQDRARMAESQLDLAIRRAATAESLLKFEWELSGGRFVSVAMPHLGEACTEGTVTRWLKDEGEHVEAGEPLLEVSSGRTSTTLSSPAAGLLGGIAAAEDETVPVGTQLAMIEETRPAQHESAEVQIRMFLAVMHRPTDPATAGSPAPGECPVIMPGTDDAVHEGTVTRWLKDEGEHVEAGEPLLEVSSGRTSTTLLSPAAGLLGGIAAAEDETVPVGTQLAVIEETQAARQEPADLEPLLDQFMPIKPSRFAPMSQDAPARTVIRPGECPVIMPGTDDAVHEGTVTRWLKDEGEHVEAGEPLLEVSSGRTSTTLLSPAAGLLGGIAAAEDETVPVGTQLAVIETTRPASPEPSAQAMLSMTVIHCPADPATAGNPAPGRVSRDHAGIGRYGPRGNRHPAAGRAPYQR